MKAARHPIDHGEDEQAALQAARIAVEMGVDVNGVGPGGESALHDAARQRFVTVIEFLVKSGDQRPEPAQTDPSRNPAGRES